MDKAAGVSPAPETKNPFVLFCWGREPGNWEGSMAFDMRPIPAKNGLAEAAS